ncbi:YigZ family protein [candidate division KSB1 bacterium]|nr:YigZ family protein [candidate division KSB1 bacterium]
MVEYFTITAACEAETRVKNSRFIAWLVPAQSREQAEACIAARSKLFADATHNCYAFRLGMEDHLLAYANDAHEPAGTAGRPMLQVLEARKLTNLAAVVTRYFGGTKLGIGGLIRAYSGALQAAVEAAALLPLIPMRTFQLSYQYAESASVERALRKYGAHALHGEFGGEVSRLVEVQAVSAEAFMQYLLESSAGRVVITAIA